MLLSDIFHNLLIHLLLTDEEKEEILRNIEEIRKQGDLLIDIQDVIDRYLQEPKVLDQIPGLIEDLPLEKYLKRGDDE